MIPAEDQVRGPQGDPEVGEAEETERHPEPWLDLMIPFRTSPLFALRKCIASINATKVESFTLKARPGARLFSEWKDNVYDKIMSKPGYPDMSLQWIYEVEEEHRAWDQYYEPAPFGNIGACLGDALLAIIPPARRIGRRIREIRHRFEKRVGGNGKPTPMYLKGGQILKTIHDHYKIGEINHRMEELRDRIAIEMEGDDLVRFHDDVFFCLMCQKIQPNLDFKLTKYDNQVGRHPELQHDIAIYRRVGQDDVRFCHGCTDHDSDEHGRYAWPTTCAENLLERKRETGCINTAQ